MLAALTILVMLIVAWAYFREGLFTACVMLVNVVLAGLIAFNFFEPLSDLLDSWIQDTFLDGFQDFVMLIFLFGLALSILRAVTNNLANSQIEFSPLLQQFGGAGVGLAVGYLVSGFLVASLETLPWHRNFIDFRPRSAQEGETRRFLPADRVWLAMMRHAGAYSFARGADFEGADDPYERCPTFDRAGTFELRYYRYRRYGDGVDPLTYRGELERELNLPPLGPAPPATVPPPSPAPGAGAPTPAPKDAPKDTSPAKKTSPEPKKGPASK